MKFKHTALVATLFTTAITTQAVAKTDAPELIGPLAGNKM